MDEAWKFEGIYEGIYSYLVVLVSVSLQFKDVTVPEVCSVVIQMKEICI